jgi:hypothetical protein
MPTDEQPHVDELAARRARYWTPREGTADLAERARQRYIKPESDADRAINFLGADWVTYALEHGFADVCMTHASAEEINRFMGFGQLAFFTGVLAEREGRIAAPSSAEKAKTDEQ